jgi:putative methyltransferase (TIGR04325 family)
MFRSYLQRLRHRFRPSNGFFGVYADFAEAERSAPAHVPTGYDQGATGDWYRDRLEHVAHDQYPVLFWFQRAIETGRRVVEIGGHVGVSYYSFERFIEYPQDLTWTIIDVPSVTRAGEQLARERGCSRLGFAHDLDQITGGVDILLASGSLQYVPGPLLPERVRAMPIAPRHILISETPVTAGTGYVTLQNIDVAYCPYRIHSYGDLIEPLVAMGYEIVDHWHRDRRVDVPGHPERSVEHFSGYYLRRKEG